MAITVHVDGWRRGLIAGAILGANSGWRRASLGKGTRFSIQSIGSRATGLRVAVRF